MAKKKDDVITPILQAAHAVVQETLRRQGPNPPYGSAALERLMEHRAVLDEMFNDDLE